MKTFWQIISCLVGFHTEKLTTVSVFWDTSYDSKVPCVNYTTTCIHCKTVKRHSTYGFFVSLEEANSFAKSLKEIYETPVKEKPKLRLIKK